MSFILKTILLLLLGSIAAQKHDLSCNEQLTVSPWNPPKYFTPTCIVSSHWWRLPDYCDWDKDNDLLLVPISLHDLLRIITTQLCLGLTNQRGISPVDHPECPRLAIPFLHNVFLMDPEEQCYYYIMLGGGWVLKLIKPVVPYYIKVQECEQTYDLLEGCMMESDWKSEATVLSKYFRQTYRYGLGLEYHGEEAYQYKDIEEAIARGQLVRPFRTFQFPT